MNTAGKGYVIAVCDDSEFYIPNAEHIERDDDLWLYKSDNEAAIAAENDGVKLIRQMPGVPDGVYIDSEKNRKHIASMLEQHPEYKCQTDSPLVMETKPIQNESPNISMNMRWP